MVGEELVEQLRPMIEAGRVYTAVPPLHRFELTNPRKGMEKYIYTYSDAEYQRKAAERDVAVVERRSEPAQARCRSGSSGPSCGPSAWSTPS